MKEKLKKWLPIAIPLALLFGLCYLVGILCHILNLPQSESVYDEFSGTKGTLWSNKSFYEEGEPIHIRFTLQNVSDEPVLLESEDRPVVDIYVVPRYDSMTKIYSWPEANSDDAAAQHQLELQPGEKHTIEFTVADYGKGPGIRPGGVVAYWQIPDDTWQSVRLELWYARFERYTPPLP
jgi:hypothetical protein